MPDLPNNDLAGRPLVAGSAFSTTLAITAGDRDEPAAGFAGTEPVSAALVVGEGLPAAFAPSVAWQSPFDPAAPAVVLSWDAGDTADLEPATYWVYLTIGDATGAVGVVRIVGAVDEDGELLPAPLIGVAEMKSVVGSWPESLQTLATLPALKRTLSRATEDLYHAIGDRYARGGGYASARDHATRYAAMRAALDDADESNLTATVPMRRFVAFRALWYLTRFAPGAKDSSDQLRRIADHAAYEAAAALRGVVASVAGFADPVILGGPTRVMRG